MNTYRVKIKHRIGEDVKLISTVVPAVSAFAAVSAVLKSHNPADVLTATATKTKA
jgi:hypothetical protein